MGRKRKGNLIDDIGSMVVKLNNDDNPSENFEKNRQRRIWKHDYTKYLKGQSYENFISRINNPVTREDYRKKLFKLCERLEMTTEDLYQYSDELKTKKDKIELENKLRTIINKFKIDNDLKEFDPHSSIIHLQYYALKKFCEANRINLDFNWLKGLLPKIDNKGKDKAYTKDQIIKMISCSDYRSKTIILIFATSAIREGALCALRFQDITPLPEGATGSDIEGAKVVIYRGDKDQDFAFITPEAYEALAVYLDARRELGENITPTSPIILRRIPKDREKGWTETRCISESTVGAILVNVAVRAGIRKLSTEYTHSNRYTNKITTGFRKFAETTMIGARFKDGTHKMNPYIADRLLSHKRRGGIPVTKHYDQSEIFEDYKHVISDLTFSKEAEYKAKLQDASGKLEGIEHAKNYIQQKEKEFNKRWEEMEKRHIEEMDWMKTALVNTVLNEKPPFDLSKLTPLILGRDVGLKLKNQDGETKKISIKPESMLNNFPKGIRTKFENDIKNSQAEINKLSEEDKSKLFQRIKAVSKKSVNRKLSTSPKSKT